MQRARLAAEADSVYDRSMDQARLRANFMPLIDLLPTLGLVGILWYGGHQVLAGNLERRRHRRRQPLRPDVDLAAAHDRHARRSVAAFGRGRRAGSTRCSRPIPRSRTSRRAAAARGSRQRAVRRRDVRLRRGPARARRPRPRDPRRRSRRARRRDRVGQDHDRAADPALLRRPRGACCIDGVDVREARLRRRAPRGRARVRRHVPVLRHACATTSRSPIPRRRWKQSCAPRASRVPTSSCASCPTATTPSSASTVSRCRVVSGNASRSPVRCSPIRAS